jgi:hypothetical protein
LENEAMVESNISIGLWIMAAGYAGVGVMVVVMIALALFIGMADAWERWFPPRGKY